MKRKTRLRSISRKNASACRHKTEREREKEKERKRERKNGAGEADGVAIAQRGPPIPGETMVCAHGRMGRVWRTADDNETLRRAWPL